MNLSVASGSLPLPWHEQSGLADRASSCRFGSNPGVDPFTLEAARRGDRSACGKLLTTLQDVWYRYCLSQLRDPDLAADATQETGLRFLRQLPSFRGESQLQTWSLGIALNVTREL